MIDSLREDARFIIDNAIKAVMPEPMTKQALQGFTAAGRLFLVAIGKAAWRMSAAAYEVLGANITQGIVITKYKHNQGPLARCKIFEAGHPILDANSLQATAEVLSLTKDLSSEDQVLFLVSGGGSSLFECLSPGISLEDVQNISTILIHSGASIEEINCVRKHMSQVKGGRFARWVDPARVTSLILSDVIGDQLDVIASGPCIADASTCRDALDVLAKYHISPSAHLFAVLQHETPKKVGNCFTEVIGNVQNLMAAAAECAKELGYETHVLPRLLQGEARIEAKDFAQKACEFTHIRGKHAIICGGETVVKVRGNGRGGRCSEFALAASQYIKGEQSIVISAVGSDGTDGPTDAAGGMIDGSTIGLLEDLHIDITAVLTENDSYSALDMIHQLVKTGPTGTNVNDLYIALIGER